MSDRREKQELDTKLSQYLIEKIKAEFNKQQSKNIKIYFSLEEILGFSVLKGSWIKHLRDFTYLDEYKHEAIIQCLVHGVPYRSKNELMNFNGFEDVLGDVMHSLSWEDVEKFDYFGFGKRLENGKTIVNYRLESVDVSANNFSSFFRDKWQESFTRWNEAWSGFFITKERLVFHVGYWELILSDSYVAKLIAESKQECYIIWENTIVNVDKSIYIQGNVTKKISDSANSHAGEIPSWWKDLIHLLQGGKIDCKPYILWSPEQMAFEKRYRNLAKLTRKLTWKNCISQSKGELKLNNVKKG